MESNLSDSVLILLQSKCNEIRQQIIKMVHTAQSGHIGGSLGATELLVTLYYHLMNHRPDNPNWEQRDRFVLSKGHCTPVLYAILADQGYFPQKDLWTFRRPGSHLQGHPYQPNTPGVEATTGALGIGFSTTLGMALTAKLKGEKHRYFVVCGDGEIQEGEVWEAAMFANKYRLDNVIAFVDRNYLQTDGNSEDIMPLDPLVPKWEAFGWITLEIDGHDITQIVEAVSQADRMDGPVMIIANTIKGKGVSFMENAVEWHGGVPSTEDANRALAELTNGI
jgi:transketolase